MRIDKKFSFDVVAPVFPVRDLKRSILYYTDSLLFTTGFEWSDGPDEPSRYVILQQDNTELHLSQTQSPQIAVAYFFLQDVKNYYDAIKENGVECSQDLQDFPWEMREFEVTDPDGNKIIFGEHLSRIGD